MYIRTLDYLGFDVSGSKVILIKTLRDASGLSLIRVKHSIEKGEFDELMEEINEIGEMRISLIDYDKSWVDQELDKLIPLWTGERDPILYKNRKNKCKKCVFSNICEDSLSR